jgi:hypothetical protein
MAVGECNNQIITSLTAMEAMQLSSLNRATAMELGQERTNNQKEAGSVDIDK